MLLTLAGFGSGFYIAYRMFTTNHYYYGADTEWVSVVLIGFLIGIGIAFCLGLILAGIGGVIPQYKKVTLFKYDIANLKMGSSVNGSFCLGYGSIETEPVYYFYTKKDEQYQLHYIPALSSKIIEDNNEKRSIVAWQSQWNYTLTGILIALFVIPISGDKKYIITIPEGSILHNYQPL